MKKIVIVKSENEEEWIAEGWVKGEVWVAENWVKELKSVLEKPRKIKVQFLGKIEHAEGIDILIFMSTGHLVAASLFKRQCPSLKIIIFTIKGNEEIRQILQAKKNSALTNIIILTKKENIPEVAKDKVMVAEIENLSSEEMGRIVLS